MAKGFNISLNEKESTSKIVSRLADVGAITPRKNQLIRSLLNICNSAAHGAIISKDQAFEVIDIGEVLVKEYIAWLSWGFRW